MPIRESHEIFKVNKLYKKWYFNTLSFEQFAEIGNAFYKLDITNKKRKKIFTSSDKRMDVWFKFGLLIYEWW